MSHTRAVSSLSYCARALCIACLVSAFLLSPLAQAHDVKFGRLVHVRFLAEGAEVAMVVQVHAGPDALKVRQRFDADGDDQLGPQEIVALRQWFADEAFRDFSLAIGGDEVVLDLFDMALDLGGDDGVIRGEELLFRVVRRGTFVLRPGPRQLVVTDAPANRREEIALRLDLPPPLPVTTRGAEGGNARIVPMGGGSYQALIGGEPASLTLEVEAPATW